MRTPRASPVWQLSPTNWRPNVRCLITRAPGNGPAMTDGGTVIEATSRRHQVMIAAPRHRRRVSTPRAVLAVAVLGSFIAFVDATIVNIAVPRSEERRVGK